MKAHFEYARYHATLEALRGRVRSAVDAGGEPLQSLVAELAKATLRGEGERLRVALIGAYNAGKSSIARAMTGREDIRISAAVETDRVTAYEWNGIELLDTPGIHAGHPEHDERTLEAVASADLLAFVVTGELFDVEVARLFRKLAFERKKARELMLIVNKGTLDGAPPEVKIPDLERVTAPLRMDELRAVFIDAKCALEAAETADAEEREELRALSNFDAFVSAFNGFVRERGTLGRLAGPVQRLRDVVVRARDLLVVEGPQERALVELLHRKRGVLTDSRMRLDAAVLAALTAAAAEIVTVGEQVALIVEPGVTAEVVAAAEARACQRAQVIAGELATAIRRLLDEELTRLDADVVRLSGSGLAERVRQSSWERVAAQNAGAGRPEGATAPSAPPDLSRAQAAARAAERLGKFVSAATFGEAVTGLGTSAGAAGSQVHQLTLAVGKFFGKSFKPWEAVRWAKGIGNIGRIVGLAGAVLGVALQIAEDIRQKKYARQLREARDALRVGFLDLEATLRGAVWGEYRAFSSAFYQAELDAVDGDVAAFTGAREARTGTARTLAALQAECDELLAALEASPEGDGAGRSGMTHALS